MINVNVDDKTCPPNHGCEQSRGCVLGRLCGPKCYYKKVPQRLVKKDAKDLTKDTFEGKQNEGLKELPEGANEEEIQNRNDLYVGECERRDPHWDAVYNELTERWTCFCEKGYVENKAYNKDNPNHKLCCSEPPALNESNCEFSYVLGEDGCSTVVGCPTSQTCEQQEGGGYTCASKCEPGYEYNEAYEENPDYAMCCPEVKPLVELNCEFSYTMGVDGCSTAVGCPASQTCKQNGETGECVDKCDEGYEYNVANKVCCLIVPEPNAENCEYYEFNDGCPTVKGCPEDQTCSGEGEERGCKPKEETRGATGSGDGGDGTDTTGTGDGGDGTDTTGSDDGGDGTNITGGGDGSDCTKKTGTYYYSYDICCKPKGDPITTEACELPDTYNGYIRVEACSVADEDKVRCTCPADQKWVDEVGCTCTGWSEYTYTVVDGNGCTSVSTIMSCTGPTEATGATGNASQCACAKDENREWKDGKCACKADKIVSASYYEKEGHCCSKIDYTYCVGEEDPHADKDKTCAPDTGWKQDGNSCVCAEGYSGDDCCKLQTAVYYIYDDCCVASSTVVTACNPEAPAGYTSDKCEETAKGYTCTCSEGYTKDAFGMCTCLDYQDGKSYQAKDENGCCVTHPYGYCPPEPDPHANDPVCVPDKGKKFDNNTNSCGCDDKKGWKTGDDGRCVCDDTKNYYENNGSCVFCDLSKHKVWDETNKKCTCANGYESSGTDCVCKMTTVDYEVNIDGCCVPSQATYCPMETAKPTFPKCEQERGKRRSSYDGRCFCDVEEGWTSGNDGVCVCDTARNYYEKEGSCIFCAPWRNEVWDDTNKECTCADGYCFESGICRGMKTGTYYYSYDICCKPKGDPITTEACELPDTYNGYIRVEACSVADEDKVRCTCPADQKWVDEVGCTCTGWSEYTYTVVDGNGCTSVSTIMSCTGPTEATGATGNASQCACAKDENREWKDGKCACKADKIVSASYYEKEGHCCSKIDYTYCVGEEDPHADKDKTCAPDTGWKSADNGGCVCDDVNNYYEKNGYCVFCDPDEHKIMDASSGCVCDSDHGWTVSGDVCVPAGGDLHSCSKGKIWDPDAGSCVCDTENDYYKNNNGSNCLRCNVELCQHLSNLNGSGSGSNRCQPYCSGNQHCVSQGVGEYGICENN